MTTQEDLDRLRDDLRARMAEKDARIALLEMERDDANRKAIYWATLARKSLVGPVLAVTDQEVRG